MENNKQWYKSKTVWAGIILLAQAIYEYFGTIAPQYFGFAIPPLPQGFESFIENFFAVTVLHGRLTASKTLSK